MRHFHRFLLLAICAFRLNLAVQAQPGNVTTAAAVANTTTSGSAPDTIHPAIQDHVDRLMDIINGVAPLFNETEYENRFVASFISALPLEDIAAAVEDLRQTSETWLVLGYADVESATAVVAIISPTNTEEPVLAMQISIDPADDNKINGLGISPADPQLENPPTTVKDAVDQLQALGQNLNYLVAEAGQGDEDQCRVLAGKGIEAPAPMGSMFKFWVLGAVVDAIHNKTITWDDLVYITDDVRSLPSGIVQNDPPGSNRTVQELAELMISISDNTATDLLLELVGRTAVEQAQVDYGHENAALNMPFLTTKDLFLLKLDGAAGDGQPGPLGQKYIEGDEAERRAILEGFQNTTINSADLDITGGWNGGPIAIEDLEWFGSPLDLCNVLVRLYKDEEAARIISLNPGIEDEQGIWSYIGFKGGSEPGVLGLAWYLVPADDSSAHRVVTGTLWDTTRAIDETQAALLFGAFRDLSLKEDFVETPSESEDPDASGSESGARGFAWVHPLLLVLSLTLHAFEYP